MTTHPNCIHFSDHNALRKMISGEWSEFGTERIVTRTDIDQFSQLTQNQQWIHTDDERCKHESPYGGLIAHGVFILTLIPSLLPPESFQVVGHKQRIVRGCDRFRFPAPVYPEESVRARAKLLDVQPATSGKGIVLSREIEVYAEKRTTPVVTANLLLQYF